MIRSNARAWTGIFDDLRFSGMECAPRGQRIMEIEDYQVEFQMDETICPFSNRNLSLRYLAGELAWYLRASRNDRSIETYSGFWKTIASDVPPRWNSNYGYFLFAQGQFKRVVDTLLRDKDSRQACIVLNTEGVAHSKSKDKICTNAIMFRIRQDRLNMTVQMRSNDVILGLGYDAPIFGIIHEMMLHCLRYQYKDLRMGRYAHNAASLHIYERHWDLLNDPGSLLYIELPELRDKMDVATLRLDYPLFEERYREQGIIESSSTPFIQTVLKWLREEVKSSV